MMYRSNATSVQGANGTQFFQGVQFVMEPRWLVVTRLTVETIIALAGVIGNFVVCLVITKHRTLNRAPPNIYIRNVAVGDLANLLVSFPLGTVREQFTYWPLEEFTCRYIFPLSDIFFGVSVWSISAIAVDRYRILTADVPRLALKSIRTAKIVCTAIWIFSFLGISLPLVLVYEYYHLPNEKPTCYAAWPTAELPLIYSIAMSLVTYAIPLVLIVVAYFAIKRRLHIKKSSLVKLAKENSAEFSTTSHSHIRLMKSRSKRFNKIMIPVVVVFAITVLPLSIFRLIPHFYVKNAIIQKYYFIIFKICIFFYLFNTACNPLIYFLISRGFRKSFFKLFLWK